MSDAWTDPLLPPTQTRLEAALGQSMRPVGLTPEVIATLWNPWLIHANLLPWLAWALSVDEWDNAWTEATQRAVCAASFPVHRKKGTVGAVRRAMNAIGYRTRLIEAWQQTPPGTPHTFTAEIEIDDRGLDAGTVAQFDRQISAVKPERSHFEVLIIGRSTARVHVASTVISGAVTTVQPFQITEADAPMPTYTIGTGTHAFGATTVYPIQ